MRGRRVAVWGAARTGRAAANLLVELGASVVLSDTREAVDPEGLDPRVELRGGGNVLEGAEVLVPSPGIRPALLADVGVPIMSEIELAASVCKAPLVAISGTDGKSTTTEMIGAVLRAAGKQVEVAGNIGTPLSEVVLGLPADGVLVAEVSAFQLWSCRSFVPQVAVLTNIAEDHAEYFEGDVAAYMAAKRRVFDDMTQGVALLRRDDSPAWASQLPKGVTRQGFGPVSDADWGLTDGSLSHAGEPFMAASEVPLPGPHNIANALAAFAAGHALGEPLGAMLEGIRSFVGLPHRLERVGDFEGLTFFDDSKATNPHAAAVGLRTFTEGFVAITGGYEKGLDLAPVIAELKRARHVVVMGTTAERTLQALGGAVPTTQVESMAEAVQAARDAAETGDAVILSPAASSFDRYRSYGHRGDVFQEAVRAL